MFHKRELLKLEPPKNKKADEYLYAMEKLDVVLVFYKKTVDHMRMLLVDIFCRNGDNYRVFIHKTSSEKGGYEYITYSYSTKRWLTSTFTSMRKANDNGWYQFVVYDRNVAYINREAACKYFNFDSSDQLLSKIDGRLYQTVSHKQWVKYKQLNDFMKGMPEPSKRQLNWMQTLFSDNLVGFIKGKTVFCEKCRKTTATNTVLKSGDKLKCPYCKSTLHLHGTNFRGGRDGIQENAYIITKNKGKAVIRHFKVVKYFSEDHTPNVGCHEFGRDIVEDKKIVKCERDTYQTWRKGRHNDYDSYYHYSPFCAGYLYRGNYKRAVANTPMQYCGFEFTDKSTEIKWDMVLTAYLRYPMLESLIKVGGFCRLAVDIIETVDSKIRHYYNPNKKHLDMLNPNATTLSSFLGISKNLLPDIVSKEFTLERLERASKLYKSCYSLSKEVKIISGKKHVAFRVENYTIITRHLEGTFLDYEATIPKEYKTSAVVEVVKIKDSVERMSLLSQSDKVKSPVKCQFSADKIDFTCSSTMGKADDTLEVTVTGEDTKIGFNNKYLIDALKYVESDEVKLTLNGSLAPMIIGPKDGNSFLNMVVPMRLSN